MLSLDIEFGAISHPELIFSRFPLEPVQTDTTSITGVDFTVVNISGSR